MSGLLSVIEGNPRRKSRRKKSRKVGKARRSRRRKLRASNPSHRRVHHRRKKSHRRRHRNPAIGGGAIVKQLMEAGTLGLGFVGAEVAAKAANYFIFKGGDKGTGTPLVGASLIMLKAGVGVAGYFGLKALKQEKLGKFLLLGAGIAAVAEAYKQFVATPEFIAQNPWLADYDYGSLQGYRTGQLQGWAPQAGLSDWAPQLSGDYDAYGNGAYD